MCCVFWDAPLSVISFGFLLTFEEGRIMLIVYVDDIIIIGDDETGIEEFKTFLQRQFYSKDLGKLLNFLGIEVTRSKK